MSYHVTRKPHPTIDQARGVKLEEWKTRRKLRYIQTRQQATHNSECLRRKFWSKTLFLAREMDQEEAEELERCREIERRNQEARDLQREQAQFASKQREGDENILEAERLRRAEFYSSRAHERFNDALRKEQATHAAEQEREDFLGNRLKQHRKMENQMALIRRVNFRECKESVQTVEPPIIHQVPMARPHGIPHPIDPSFVDLKETSALSSPFSGKVNEFDGIVREVTTIAVDEALRSPIWGGGALGGPGRENLTSDYEIADVDDVVSVGSIVSLNDAYMEPVSSRDAVTRGTEPGNSFRERMSVALSAQDTFRSVSRLSSVSAASMDSNTFRQNLMIRAVQLSPPKQLDNRLHFSDLRRRPIPVSPKKISTLKSPKRHPLRPSQHENVRPKNDSVAVDVVQELQDVLNVLKVLDTNTTTPVSDSFLTCSSGLLSTPGNGRNNGDVDDSWLSQQTLSQNSSFQCSNMTYSSGSLFTSFSLLSEKTLDTGMMDWSNADVENLSVISEGELEDRISVIGMENLPLKFCSE